MTPNAEAMYSEASAILAAQGGAAPAASKVYFERSDSPPTPTKETPSTTSAKGAEVSGKLPTDTTTRSDNPRAPKSNRPARAVLTRLSDVHPTPISWLWAGWVALGKMAVLDGDPGLGKSTLTCDLAARVTRGDLMPGGSPGALRGRPAGVVLMSCEDDAADTIRPRLDAAGADVSRVVHLGGVTDERGERMPNLSDLDALREAVASVDAKLVVVDPLMAYLGGDAHRDNEVRGQLGPLAILAGELGVAVILVRHLNKSTGGSALYRGGGSIGIIGAVRTGLLFARDPDDDSKRVLACAKSNVAEMPAAWSAQMVGSGLASRIEWLGESSQTPERLLAPSADNADPTLAEEAADWLRSELADGPRPSTDIKGAAREAGFAWRTVERAKAPLGVRATREGEAGVRGGGHWVWSLPRV